MSIRAFDVTACFIAAYGEATKKVFFRPLLNHPPLFHRYFNWHSYNTCDMNNGTKYDSHFVTSDEWYEHYNSI